MQIHRSRHVLASLEQAEQIFVLDHVIENLRGEAMSDEERELHRLQISCCMVWSRAILKPDS